MKKNYISIAIVFLIIFTLSCNKEKPIREVFITTDSILDISDTSIFVQGTIVDIGENKIDKWGFCWAEHENPTIDNVKYENVADIQAEIKKYYITDFTYDTHYWVRMYAIKNGEIIYGENKNFKTPKGFEISSPSNTSVWQKGTIQKISWTSPFEGNIRIELLKNNSSLKVIADNVENEGFYFWNLPIELENGSDYQILISNIENSKIQTKSEYFSISEEGSGDYITITSPNNTNEWVVGNTENITWDSNVEGDLKIELYKNNILTKTITSETPNNGNYSYTLLQDTEIGNDYSVKIISINENSVFSMSEQFQIIALPNIEFSNYVLVSDYDNESYSDGFIGKGETITLSIAIINTNPTLAENVSVLFSSSNNNILNLQNTPVEYGNVVYNQIIGREITFNIADNAPCQELFTIELEIEDSNGSVFYQTFDIQRICEPFITRITLLEHPNSPDGAVTWDMMYGMPDIYFVLYENSTIIFDDLSVNSVICDVGDSNTCWWDFLSPWSFYLDKTYKFEFLDDDSGFCNAAPHSGPDYMGEVDIIISDFIQINGNTITYNNIYIEAGEIIVELECNWQ